MVFSPNMPRNFKIQLCQIMNIKMDTQIGKYLGVYIDGHHPKKRNFEELLDRINSRLSGWKARCLSQAGRLTLIKSILQADPIYKLSILDCPVGYSRKIDRVCTNFFWGSSESSSRKLHLIKASDLRLPITQGGLALKDTKKRSNKDSLLDECCAVG